MYRKICALLIGVLMLLGTPVTASVFKDTAGLDCERAIEVLAALDIVEGKAGGNYEPDAALTRAEMTTIILRSMNMASAAKGWDVFADVPSSHWAYANIATAYQLGIVQGTSATTFEPDSVVTYEQAVKMVVASLGYTVQAEAIGGYPSGYLSKASQLDILKGVKNGATMTRGDMAVLIYNALDVELFVQSTFGADAYEFRTDESKTMLSYYLKVNKIVDRITATPMAALSFAAERRILKDEAMVGNTVMKAGASNVQSLFGVRCEVYTREDVVSDMPIVLAAIPCTNSQIVDVKTEDIVSGETDANLFVYQSGEGKTEKMDIAGAVLVWNGREETKTASLVQPSIGKVRLIANSGRDCDLIIVESYVNRVVENVNTEDSIVYFKDGSSMLLDLSDSSISTLLTDAENRPITLAELEKWDILSIAESGAGHKYAVRRLYRSYEMITGKITENSENTVVIDEVEYKVANPLAYGTISLGQMSAFYLDFTGMIAAVDENYGGGKTYGWLVSAAYTKGLEHKPQLKIFTQDGTMTVFDTASKITFNGRTVNGAELLNEPDSNVNIWADGVRPTLCKDGNAVPQLVSYQTNEEGLISVIETAANRTAPSVYADGEKIGEDFSMDWYYNYDTRSTGFNNTALGTEDFTPKDGGLPVRWGQKNIDGIFFTKVITDEDTVFFVIPADPTKEKEYAIRPLSQFGYEVASASRCVSFYDVDEKYMCGAMVMHNYMSGDTGAAYPTYSTATSALVTGMSNVLTEDGEVQKIIKLYNSDGQKLDVTVDEDFTFLYRTVNADYTKDPDWYIVKDDGSISKDKNDFENRNTINVFLNPDDLDPGDVIQYKTDSSGKLTTAAVMHRVNYPSFVEFSVDDLGAVNTTCYDYNYMGAVMLQHGTVFDKAENNPLFKTYVANTMGLSTGVEATRALSTKGSFVLWDKEKETERTITPDDIVQGDVIFVYWVTIYQKLVVVYR